MKCKERIEKLPRTNLIIIRCPYKMHDAYGTKHQEHDKKHPLPRKHFAIIGQTKVQHSRPTFAPEAGIPTADEAEKTVGPIGEKQPEQ